MNTESDVTKLKVAILGGGNIGCDILMKVQQSDLLECAYFVTRNVNSRGIEYAKKLEFPLQLKVFMPY